MRKHIFLLIVVSFCCSFLGCENAKSHTELAEKNNVTKKMIWWGVMSFELNIGDKIIHFDPFFRIHRRGDYIFCSNQFSDHSSISTKERILSISPNFKKIYEPANCRVSKTLAPYTIVMNKGDIFENEDYWVKAFYGYEATEKDIFFLIYSKKADIWFLHGGDANDPAIDHFKAAFREVLPRKIDYYLCTLGKLSVEHIKELIIEFEPHFVIPAHYPFYIIDITDEETKVQFPDENVPYLRPHYSVENFMSEINKTIKDNKLNTEIIQLHPGEELELKR